MLLKEFKYEGKLSILKISTENSETMFEKTTIIKGIIIPVDWDNKGKIIGVAIFTPDEDEIRIDKDEKGDEIFKLIHKEVEVEGMLKEMNNKKIISVRKITSLTEGGEK